MADSEVETRFPRLPPLRALRAFEAAARLQNFTRAAAELNVTQAAVSYQVKLLEESLGEALFVRHPSGLTLTRKGQLYFQVLHRAFRLIGEGTDELFGDGGRSRLVINAQPNFAMRWLVSRLPDFRRRSARVDLVLTTSVRQRDFGRDGIDVAIRYGMDQPELEYHELFRPVMLPVCSPRILKNGPPLGQPGDLLRHTLLHVVSALDDWRTWCLAAGAEPPSSFDGMQYDTYALSLQGAIEGHGIAIGHLPLVLDDLRSGRLVAPFRTVAQAERAWYLSYPRAARFGGGLSAFRLWVLERAGESRDDMQAWLGEKRPEKSGAPLEKPASRASDPAS